MRRTIHLLEIAAFLLTSAACFSRFFGKKVLYLVLACVALACYAVFWLLIRKVEVPGYARGIYMNDLCLVVLAPLFSLYRPSAFVVAGLMGIVAVIISLRIGKSPDGHPQQKGFYKGF
jgi:hypothetical protein